MRNDFEVTTIDLLRHGLPEGGEIFRGKTDVLLSEEGFQQMLLAEQKLSPRDIIVTSPLQRCAVFAEHLSDDAQSGSLLYEEGLREISFGDWDGKAFKAIAQESPELYKNYWQDPISYSPPNAEPLDEFSQRVAQTIEALSLAHKGKHLLLVTHGGLIRAALSFALGCDLKSLMRYEVPYASVSQIKIYHDEKGVFPQLVFHNR